MTREQEKRNELVLLQDGTRDMQVLHNVKNIVWLFFFPLRSGVVGLQ